MNWPWSKPKYADGSLVTDRMSVTNILKNVAPNAVVDDEYDHFLMLTYENMQALVAQYWDSSWIDYGIDAPDFPLCYDYAELAEAAVRTGSIKEGFKERAAFGVLRYTKNAPGQRHAICFVVVLVNGLPAVRYFEPQQADVRWMETPDDMKSLDDLYI